MPVYEYKVVPAPKKGVRAKGVKGGEARFAHALMDVMNSHGADGWEYQRTDTLPSEERSGLTHKTTVFQNMLIFRRVIDEQPAAAAIPVAAPAGESSDAPLQDVSKLHTQVLSAAQIPDDGEVAATTPPAPEDRKDEKPEIAAQ